MAIKISESTHFNTIADWLRFVTSEFNRNNLKPSTGLVDNLADAKALISYAIQFEIVDDYLSAQLTKPEKSQILKLINIKLKTQLPTAYLINQAWFAGLSFYVDERVLVPRSPIAELIENRFSPWLDYNQTHNILDLCTGSACIAIACAYAFPHANIDAIDLSTEALEVATINQQSHGVEHNVNLITSDLFTQLTKQKYNLIVSNPPYVDLQDMLTLPAENQHEPKIGLVAGNNGLDLVIQIINQSAEYLNKDGILIVEMGNSTPALINRYPTLDFTWLEFNNGGNGVFLLTKAQLEQWQK